MGQVRAGLRIAGLILAVLVAVPLHGLWRLFRFPSPWPRLFLGTIGRIAGARRISIGRALRRDVFFVANHQSWLDIPLLAGASGTAFIAKDNLEKVPLIGWLCGLNNTVFVSRTDRMGIAGQIEKVRAALAEGWSLAIFPEGTTTDGSELLPFKAPLLAVLDPPPAGVMVQPVWIDYGAIAPDIAWVGDEHGKDNALRILARAGSFPAEIHFLEPFDPAGFDGRKAIAAEARARIERAMGDALPATLDDAAIQARRPVWLALSDLFLDTDVSLFRGDDARILAATPFSIDQIERILVEDVTPACKPNMRDVAGEWAGFDPEWLERRIIRIRKPDRQNRPMKAMWGDWLALRAEIVRLRAQPLENPAATD